MTGTDGLLSSSERLPSVVVGSPPYDESGDQELALLITRLRTRAGLTQEELAERAGLSARSISSLENGAVRRPQRATVDRLVAALGLPASEAERVTAMARGWRRLDDHPDGIERRLMPAQPGLLAIQARSPAELPPAVVPFTGRRGEIDWLTRLLLGAPEVTGSRVAVVTGVAGVGKTALAVHWAHRLAGTFSDGQLYLDLCGYDLRDPLSVPDALGSLLTSLGVPRRDQPVDVMDRSARLRTMLADRRLLIVLDNAGSAEQVRSLLPGTGRSVCLVTSRDRLHGLVARDGAARLDLSPLPAAEAAELLMDLLGRTALPPGGLPRLVERCAGLPLALRLAAERIASGSGTTLHKITDSPADGQPQLDLLGFDGDERAGVRSVLGWSLRALPSEAVGAFALLGDFPGRDGSVDAVRAFLGLDERDAAQVLDILRNGHLIEPTAGGRLGWHDLVRAFARERAGTLDRTVRVAALTRVLDHHLAGARQALDLLAPQERSERPDPAVPERAGDFRFGSPAQACAWLDAERETMVVAACLAAGEGLQARAWQAEAVLFRYLEQEGYHEAGERLSRLAAETAAAAGAVAVRARAERHLGVFLAARGRVEAALPHLEAGLCLSRRLRDRDAEGRCLSNLGACHAMLGRLDAAREALGEALRYYREVRDPHGEQAVLSHLALTCEQAGDLTGALGYEQDSLRVARETGDDVGELISLETVGFLAWRQGDPAWATATFARGLALAAGQRARHVRFALHAGMACAALDLGQRAVAEQHVRDVRAGLGAAGLDPHQVLTLRPGYLDHLDRHGLPVEVGRTGETSSPSG